MEYGPGRDAASGAGAVGCGCRRPGVAGPRSVTAALAHRRGGQAPPAAAESGATAPGGHREPALDRCRDASRARRPDREPASRPSLTPPQLSPGVPARLGEQDVLYAFAAP